MTSNTSRKKSKARQKAKHLFRQYEGDWDYIEQAMNSMKDLSSYTEDQEIELMALEHLVNNREECYRCQKLVPEYRVVREDVDNPHCEECWMKYDWSLV